MKFATFYLIIHIFLVNMEVNIIFMKSDFDENFEEEIAEFLPDQNEILYYDVDEDDWLFMKTYDCIQKADLTYVTMYNLALLKNDTERLEKIPIEFQEFFKCISEKYGLINNITHLLTPHKLKDFVVIPKNCSQELIEDAIRCLEAVPNKIIHKRGQTLPILRCMERITRGDYKNFFFHKFPLPDYYYDDDPGLLRIDDDGNIFNSTKYHPRINKRQ